jgi:uncharacterized protein (DUF1330 family)
MAAYVLSEVQIVDEDGADRYREMAAASIRAYGGRYVVRATTPDALEGTWASDMRLVIVEFPTVDAARGWYTSADYAEALALSRTVLLRRLLLAEGVPG